VIAPIVLVESVVLAAIYLQIALAWIIIYRATKVLNFATGHFLLLGALIYTTLAVGLSLPAPIALLAAAAITAALAMVCHDVLLRPLAGRPVFSQIIVTVGLSIVMTTVMTLIWGNQPRPLASPLPRATFTFPGGGVLTNLHLIVIALSLVLFGGLLLFLQRSRPGRQMRAAAESPLLASQTGLNINHIYRLSWGIAAITMVFAGVAYAHLTLISQSITELGLRGIAPALIGGLDDVRGAIVGAYAIAVTENLAAVYWGGQVRNVVPFAVILIVLLIRPYGLFGAAEVRRV
jgi:branched-chain amino acid transport system permease protein